MFDMMEHLGNARRKSFAININAENPHGDFILRARAPLRLGLAGGGTDVSPYCDTYGGNVLNATIDRYAYAVIKLIDEPLVKLQATDQNLQLLQCSEEALILDGKLNLHKAVYNYFMMNHNKGVYIPMEICTFCDAPIGSGLGSSSTLVVAMVKVFAEFFSLPMDDYSVAQLAYRLERVDCRLMGGRQDQYSAAFGGFNFMEFYKDGKTIVNPLRIKGWVVSELEASLILFYTGVSRESARIIAAQSSNVESKDDLAIKAMHGLKQEALSMKECLLTGNFSGLVGVLRRGWESKKKSAPTITNKMIDEIYDSAMEAGALAGKISGAGGGGFMLFFAPCEKRANVISALGAFKGQVSNCHFTENGVQSWRVQ
jgi:D-glycero-alpha-D-manno-heptose-7-phosphate kinase